jgi:DNA-binding transcriptional ArsR family regulator
MDIDRKTLKALAADTRLDILKSLGKRRKMPSELSKELNLATSTVVEHLDKLEEADLIKREETGHKWIYYSLTDKGSALVKPRIPTNFVIILGVCILVVFIGSLYYYNLNQFNFAGVSTPTLTVPESQRTGGESQAEVPKQTGEIPSAVGATSNITSCDNTCADCNKIIMKNNYQRGEKINASVTFCQDVYTSVNEIPWKLYKYENGNWSPLNFYPGMYVSCNSSQKMCGEYLAAIPSPICIKHNVSEKIDWVWDQNVYGNRKIECFSSTRNAMVNWTCSYNYLSGDGNYKLEFDYNSECPSGWFNFTNIQHLEREFTIGLAT